MKTKMLLAAAAMLLSFSAAQAAIVTDLGVDPTSSSGAFSEQVGGGAFDNQLTFQLVGGPQFLTIASVTNVFPSASDFITGFTGSVFEQVGAIGGGDDILVIGPVAATANCGPNCQGFAGSALLDAGNYYLDVSGTGGGTSGYGGNLAVAAVPEPSTWAMLLLGFCGIGLMAYRRKGSSLRVA
jgi:hypothetical protein